MRNSVLGRSRLFSFARADFIAQGSSHSLLSITCATNMPHTYIQYVCISNLYTPDHVSLTHQITKV